MPKHLKLLELCVSVCMCARKERQHSIKRAQMIPLLFIESRRYLLLKYTHMDIADIKLYILFAFSALSENSFVIH